MRLGENVQMRVETVPSGSLTLDVALGGDTTGARHRNLRPRVLR